MCALTFTKKDEQSRAFAHFVEVLDASKSLAICAHTNPDGDALGSELALAKIVSCRWPSMQIFCLLADDDGCPHIYRFMSGSDKLLTQEAFYELGIDQLDCFFVVDLSSVHRLNNAEEICRKAARVLVLDHHPFSESFWDVALIREDSAATGILVKDFADYLGISLDKASADALLCALVTDTGRFQYQNTNEEALLCASALVSAGANPNLVAEQVYQSDSLAYLKLEALAMSRIELLCDGKIAFSYSTCQDLERLGVSLQDCDGLIDAVRRVDGAEVILFLKELSEHCVRGSLRAKGACDVGALASELGGGGHRAAAGFTLYSTLDEAKNKLLPMLSELIS